MKPSFIFLLAALSSANLFGQENFVSAVVVTAAGDTLKGSIDDQLWQHTPAFIKFRNASGAVSVLYPKDLREFRIMEKSIYISERIKYDSSSNAIEDVSMRFSPTFKDAHVFLKIVTRSRASLLALQLAHKTHFFIQSKDTVEELVNHRYFVYRNGLRVILQNRAYIEQLRRHFKDCSSIKIPDGLPYSEGKLASLFLEYNSCMNSKTEAFKKDELTILTYGLTALCGYDRYKPYEGGIGYGIGPSLVVKLPNRNYRYSIYTELIYRKTAKQTGKVSGNSAPSEYIKIQSLQLAVVARSRLSANVSKLFLGIGTSVRYGLQDEYGLKYTGYTRTNNVILGRQAWFTNSLILSAGIDISKRSMLELRYESGGMPYFKDYPNHYTKAEGYSSVQAVFVLQF